MGNEYNKAVYCHSAYLTYMQGTSCKMPGWVRHHPNGRKQRGTKEPLDESERGE